MEKITGTVERIVYRNISNDFTIFRLKSDNDKQIITVKGIFYNIHPGISLEISGQVSMNKYGEQFEAVNYCERPPLTLDNIERYLASGLIKGIGPVYAKKIIEKFGESTLDILELNTKRLLEIPGIGSKKVNSIILSVEKQKDIKEVMLFLSGFGISSNYALKIYRNYGKDSIDIVSKNPYQLAEDIVGIGFIIADQIALKMGFEENSLARSKAAIFYALRDKSRSGHVFVYRNELEAFVGKIVNIENEQISYALDILIKENKLYLSNEENKERIYLPYLYLAETGIVKELYRLSEINNLNETENIDRIINDLIDENKLLYNDAQINAIRLSYLSKILVVTGGPGTGKTTTVIGIIEMLKKMHLSVVLAAPTGRAAKRLSEVTGCEGQTIHRLLEYNMETGFQRNNENKLDGNVFILDECSMIDVNLLYSFLIALPDKASIIFAGDVDQLPSVGPGSILRDIIDSHVVPVVYLEEIFRQAKESKIIKNAHLINKKQKPDLTNNNDSDFFYIREPKAEKAVELLVDLCAVRLPEKYGINPIKDIQVLVPMKKGIHGSVNLNKVIQGVLNPHGKSLIYGDNIFRIGDKVMQIRNNYEKRIFNGDIGKIVDIDDDCMLMVDFDGDIIPFEQSELDELLLGYCVTIHKSQGSEYEVVVILLSSQHYIMLEKNLLYTAVTRAKKLLVLISTDEVIGATIKREHVLKRNSYLANRLVDYFNLQ
ncbi:MAG: ATP-dependent RecD-like DNA helicase [Firmicutes bacterium]|nr:ATP-dependent RecD-like DNA helicase [Bacillota bacterium]